jgi:hypothetical protein
MKLYAFIDDSCKFKDGVIKKNWKSKDAKAFMLEQGNYKSGLDNVMSIIKSNTLDSNNKDIMLILDFESPDKSVFIDYNMFKISCIPLYMSYTDDELNRRKFKFNSHHLYLQHEGIQLQFQTNYDLVTNFFKLADNGENASIKYKEIVKDFKGFTLANSIIINSSKNKITKNKTFNIKEVDKRLDGYLQELD